MLLALCDIIITIIIAHYMLLLFTVAVLVTFSVADLSALTVKYIFCMHQIFTNFASRIKSEIEHPQKFSLPTKDLVNTTTRSRTLRKHEIKMQQNFFFA